MHAVLPLNESLRGQGAQTAGQVAPPSQPSAPQGPARTSAPARTLRNSLRCSTNTHVVCLKQVFCSSCCWLPSTDALSMREGPARLNTG